MWASKLFLVELALVYFLGAVTGPLISRLGRKSWRRLRRRKRDWDRYFQN